MCGGHAATSGFPIPFATARARELAAAPTAGGRAARSRREAPCPAHASTRPRLRGCASRRHLQWTSCPDGRRGTSAPPATPSSPVRSRARARGAGAWRLLAARGLGARSAALCAWPFLSLFSCAFPSCVRFLIVFIPERFACPRARMIALAALAPSAHAAACRNCSRGATPRPRRAAPRPTPCRPFSKPTARPQTARRRRAGRSAFSSCVATPPR